MADARKCAQRLWCREAADIINAGIDPIFGTKLLAGRFQDGSSEQKAQEAWQNAEQDGKCRSAEEAKANRRAA